MKNLNNFALGIQDNAIEDNSSLSSGTLKSAKLASNEAFFSLHQKNGVKNGISFTEYRLLCMARRKRKLPYKKPTIIRNKSGDWYIQYYFEPPHRPGEWEPFKVRSGINYIKDPAEKELEAGYLREDVEDWLKDGNGPYDFRVDVVEQVTEMEQQIEALEAIRSGWTISEATERYLTYLKFKGYAHNTTRTYRKYVITLQQWCGENELSDKPIASFNEFELEEFLNESAEVNDWSGRTFNNYLKYYGGFFAKVQSLERRENRKNGKPVNTRYDIDVKDIELRITAPQRNKPYDPILRAQIKKALQVKGRENLQDYIEWIYYSSMRPDEIRHLKVSNIDHISRQIRIMGKTGDRLVPINDGLLNLINTRGVLQTKREAFVFGYAGTISMQRMSVAYFLEQYTALKIDIGTNTPLGPYNWKHTGIQDLLNAGFSEEEAMMQTGHKTKEAFRAYTKGFSIDRSHVMKGKTVSF